MTDCPTPRPSPESGDVAEKGAPRGGSWRSSCCTRSRSTSCAGPTRTPTPTVTSDSSRRADRKGGKGRRQWRRQATPTQGVRKWGTAQSGGEGEGSGGGKVGVGNGFNKQPHRQRGAVGRIGGGNRSGGFMHSGRGPHIAPVGCPYQWVSVGSPI